MKRRCQKCCECIRESFDGEPVGLFISHVKAVLTYLHDKYPSVRPIMWDDMLRSAPYEVVKGRILFRKIDFCRGKKKSYIFLTLILSRKNSMNTFFR